jgi:hypothetical protein
VASSLMPSCFRMLRLGFGSQERMEHQKHYQGRQVGRLWNTSCENGVEISQLRRLDELSTPELRTTWMEHGISVEHCYRVLLCCIFSVVQYCNDCYAALIIMITDAWTRILRMHQATYIHIACWLANWNIPSLPFADSTKCMQLT